MGLIFPRLANNFARNGYFPTDEGTLERILAALAPSAEGSMRILDPCAGEGVAVAECKHHLGAERCEAHAVEYDEQRAYHAKGLVERCIHGDFFLTALKPAQYGLLFHNPPYGDSVADQAALSEQTGSGRQRLEKRFYQQTHGLLQEGGVMVLIVPHYVLDAELSGCRAGSGATSSGCGSSAPWSMTSAKWSSSAFAGASRGRAARRPRRCWRRSGRAARC